MPSALIVNQIMIVYLFILATINLSESLKSNCFPHDFKFGVGTSAYQIEGAWNEDGKGESIWDNFTHIPGNIIDGSNGDVADDSYHRYKEDIIALKNLGASVYRFSIAWTRIFPTGEINKVNQAGVDYYNKLIDELLKNDIEPFVTLYHWDLPQALQDRYGGWLNPIMVEYFGNYSRFIFEKFGDRVKYWVTFNEPQMVCIAGYGSADIFGGLFFAPGLKKMGVGEYLCAHTVLNAHARAYHIYDKEFKAKQKGGIGFTLVSGWYEPISDKPEDVAAANRALSFYILWFAYPILHGRYPDEMVKRIGEKSIQQGFNKSRLPEFTEEESKLVIGTYDFATVNHYLSTKVKYKKDTFSKTPSFQNDLSVDEETCSNCAWGLRKMLDWAVKVGNNHTDIYITENGVHDPAEFYDYQRIRYHDTYLKSLLRAIRDDGVRIVGYIAWSLIDNFEWSSGYTKRFGFYYVGQDDPNRTRRPKKSVKFISKIYKHKCIPN